MKIIIHTDGGARGNPGPAAVGVVIEETSEKKNMIAAFGKTIGETTNNVAEYTGVIEALKKVQSSEFLAKRDPASRDKVQNGAELQISFFLDSLLVVNQLNGIFKIKDSTLRQLLSRIRILEQEVGGVVTYTHIPREQNAAADALVNQALDA